MNEVIDLATKRPPVVYSVTMSQGWDNTIGVTIHDVNCDDPKCRLSVAMAMMDAASLIMQDLGIAKQHPVKEESILVSVQRLRQLIPELTEAKHSKRIRKETARDATGAVMNLLDLRRVIGEGAYDK